MPFLDVATPLSTLWAIECVPPKTKVGACLGSVTFCSLVLSSSGSGIFKIAHGYSIFRQFISTSRLRPWEGCTRPLKLPYAYTVRSGSAPRDPLKYPGKTGCSPLDLVGDSAVSSTISVT